MGSYQFLTEAWEASDPSWNEDEDGDVASAQAMARARYARKRGNVAADAASSDLSEYDLRRAYTGQDPHAVARTVKLEVHLRLATLSGIRMLVSAPQRSG